MTAPAPRHPGQRLLPGQQTLIDIGFDGGLPVVTGPGHEELIRGIEALIAARGMSLSELSEHARLKESSLYSILKGRVVPPLRVLERLLDALDAPPLHRRVIRGEWERFQELNGPRRPKNIVSTARAESDIHRLRQDVPGYDLKPDPLAVTSKEEFVATMREWHIWAGEPSYREIALNARKSVGASTLCEALDPNKPARLPTLKVVTAFIYGCGGSEEDLTAWTTAWRRVRMARNTSNITHLAAVEQRHIS